MTDQPSELALAALKKRIEQDTVLDAAVREGMLRDLGCSEPLAFEGLMTALRGGGSNEDNGTAGEQPAGNSG
ncbi:hypothetical protein [Microvirga sp. KLBC 81]|uniref:hypothetical protein n=1 Tax=Microvirga sp. KLBC 81 TaxID=1862707 RepID=UPI00105793C6|nr:hypothetical protein [Microvirga sp. KLBC 81]